MGFDALNRGSRVREEGSNLTHVGPSDVIPLFFCLFYLKCQSFAVQFLRRFKGKICSCWEVPEWLLGHVSVHTTVDMTLV